MRLKKGLALLLSTSMVFASVTNIAFAEENTNEENASVYSLTVNGEQFSEEKSEIQCGKGTAKFDNDTSTLTLNNAEITEILGYSGGCISSQLDELKIVLVGENTVTNKYNTGISATGNVTISGEGVLNVYCYTGIEAGSYGSQNGTITVKDTTVILNTDAGCLSANSDVHLENSVFEAKVNPGTYSYAMAVSMGTTGKFVVTNSDVTIESADNSAISMGDVFSETERKLIIHSGNVTLRSKGGSSPAIYFTPIAQAAIEINGGLLKVECMSQVTNIEDSAITLKNMSVASGSWSGRNIKVTHEEHKYGSEWMYDEKNHWHECECGEKQDMSEHTGGIATEQEQAICEICGISYGNKVKPVETTKEPENEETTTEKLNKPVKPVETSARTVKVAKTRCKKATKKYRNTKIKISLKKISGVSKYQIQISKSKKFKKVLVRKTVKKAKFTIKSKKIKNKKKLYVRARAIKIVNKKEYRGKWSNAKRVKVKK